MKIIDYPTTLTSMLLLSSEGTVHIHFYALTKKKKGEEVLQCEKCDCITILEGQQLLPLCKIYNQFPIGLHLIKWNVSVITCIIGSSRVITNIS